MAAQGEGGVSRVCENEFSEIWSKTNCVGTGSLVIYTIYYLIEGDNVTAACVCCGFYACKKQSTTGVLVVPLKELVANFGKDKMFSPSLI